MNLANVLYQSIFTTNFNLTDVTTPKEHFSVGTLVDRTDMHLNVCELESKSSWESVTPFHSPSQQPPRPENTSSSPETPTNTFVLQEKQPPVWDALEPLNHLQQSDPPGKVMLPAHAQSLRLKHVRTIALEFWRQSFLCRVSIPKRRRTSQVSLAF